MRITGGTLAGRKIECPPGIIRPAMDRMRESMFSILGPLQDKSFVDIFSGSALVGLEAYSRGATNVVCVEKDRGKKDILLKNLALADKSVRLIITSAEKFILTAKTPYDIIYLDPPFDYSFKTDLLRRVIKSRLVHENSLILIHFPNEDRLPETLNEEWKLEDKRKYGRSIVHFYSKQTTVTN